jgi:aminopeptidase N
VDFNFDEIIKGEENRYLKHQFLESNLTSTYNVTYYKLEISVNPDTQFIAGSVLVYFVPNKDILEINFDLNSILMVDSVKYGANHEVFSHKENVISVNKVFTAGSLDSLRFYYHGEPPKNGTSFVQSEHNGTPIIWTLSEPYGAVDWWPHKQSLLDKADSLDLIVWTSKGNKVAGNGSLESTEIHGDSIRVHWKCRYPIVPYLVAISVTPYAEISFQTPLQNGGLFVQNYVYKEDSASALISLPVTDSLLRFYDSIIGPYPFMNEKYGHAQFGRGGGMEHQTMSFMYHFGFGLTAHELAHQWFGDLITCGSWQDIWLNEGFATYFSGVPLEFMYNGEFWLEWKQNNLERATSEPEGSIYVSDTTDVGRIFNPNLSYAKGGHVLHMLRKQIGDSLFFKGIRSYSADTNLMYKTAITEDFFRHIELVADTNLQLFMMQWIYGQGFPSYNLEWEQIGDNLKIKLAQTTSHASVPFYYLKVPVLLEGDNGLRKLMWLKHEDNGQLFEIDVTFEVKKITINSEYDIISKANFVINKSSFTDLVLYPNPTSDVLTVIPGGDFSRVTAYKVFSADGRIMLQADDLINTTAWSINVNKWVQGNYKMVLYSGIATVTKSFVVVK